MLRGLTRLAGLPQLAGWHRVLPAAPSAACSFSTSSNGNEETSDSQQASQGLEWPKLVVFGGRGYVGSAVCQEAVRTGLQVVSISPSGTPPLDRSAWTQQVTWARGNALEPVTYEHHLRGAVAAISCVGAFGSQQYMLQVNGDANTAIVQAAKRIGVPRFVYISAHIPSLPVVDTLVKGYIDGKRVAEAALQASYPDSGVALRPSFIYGHRHVTTSLALPLNLVGAPWKALLAHLPQPAVKQAAALPFLGALATPPCSVEAVAKVAVRAATDASVAGGVIDAWEIANED